VDFAIQPEARGTADAVLAAATWTQGEPFLVLNSDNYYPPEAYVALATLAGPGLPGFSRQGLLASGAIRAERIAAFALLEVAADGTLRRIVEKPDAATLASFGDNPLVSMNCWRFGPEVFDACRAVAPSPRGELELPTAVQYAIERLGTRLTVVPFDVPVLDLSTRDDIAVVARALAATEVRL
jgi:glucose-1-phosphate thymidylyltransferase